MDVLHQLAEYVVHARFSEHDREKMSVHLTDTLAAMICGYFTVEGRKIQTYFFKQHQTVFHQCSEMDELLNNLSANCAITRLTEIDDIHLASCITPGSVIVPTAWALFRYEKNRFSIDSLLDAMLVGYELFIRLGLAVRGAELVYRGIWPTYLCAPFAAAATTARLIGLGEQQTAHALALSLTLSTGGVSNGPVHPFRWLTLGHAARSGCMAAFAASHGFTGNTSMLDGDWLAQTYGIPSDRSRLTIEAGNEATIHTVSMKPYCSAKQVIPSVYALHRLMEHGISEEEMEKIVVHVPACFVSMLSRPPRNRLSSMTSAPYQMGLAVFQPERLYDVNREKLENAHEMEAFMEKVQIVADPDLTESYPEKWPTKLEVYTKNDKMVQLVTDVPGDPAMPLLPPDRMNKMNRLLSPLVGRFVTDRLMGLSNVISNDRNCVEQLLDIVEQILVDSYESIIP